MEFTIELSKGEIEIITERQLFRMNWVNTGMDKTEPIDFVLQKILDAANASQQAVAPDTNCYFWFCEPCGAKNSTNYLRCRACGKRR